MTEYLVLNLYFNAQNKIYIFVLQRVEADMEAFLKTLRSKVKVALVGGSDLVKIAEQMGGDDGRCWKILFSEILYHKIRCKNMKQNYIHLEELELFFQMCCDLSLKYHEFSIYIDYLPVYSYWFYVYYIINQSVYMSTVILMQCFTCGGIN